MNTNNTQSSRNTALILTLFTTFFLSALSVVAAEKEQNTSGRETSAERDTYRAELMFNRSKERSLAMISETTDNERTSTQKKSENNQNRSR